MNKNFKGFSAGDPITLSQWRNSIKVAGIDSDKLTFCIMQLIPGAIGNEKRDVREDVSTMMARTIATALFDDFFEIGEKHNNKLNAIHLLDLNGVYIPLSFFF